MAESLLGGIRYVDLTMHAAGPYASELMAFMGAQVIRVESRERPDDLRRWHEPQCCELNLNKLDVTLNLRKPKAIDILKRLVMVSDVVAESFRPGFMTGIGLTYEVLRQLKPDIILASLSGFGATGPEAQWRSYAAIFGAMGGLANITGYSDGIPTEQRVAIDMAAGQMFSFAILAALMHRSRTGEGQSIDFSACEAISTMIGDVAMDYVMNGRVQTGKGNRDDAMAPHNCYRCKGEDKWVSIAVSTDEEWKALCAATGHPEWLQDERFVDAYKRLQYIEELDRLVSGWTAERTPYEAMNILQQAGVAAAPSVSSADVFADPHLRARDFITEIENPKYGKRLGLAAPWKLSATPARITRHGPLVGQDNSYVFREILGMSIAEVAALEEEKVIY